MAWTKAKTAIVVGAGVLLAAGTTTLVVVSKLGEPLLPMKSMPNPNGYDDLVKAGQMASTNSGNDDPTSHQQLLETTLANAKALELARAGLNKECRVPLQFSETYIGAHLSVLADIKRLAKAFLVEGKLAEIESRPNDAAKSYLDAMRLGVESARGGVLIDQLVGTACEALGTRNLQKLAGTLDGKTSHDAAEVLERLDTDRQTWNEVMRQENDWARRTFSSVRYEFARLMTRKSLEQSLQRAKQKFHAQQLKTRQLMIELAARAYALDKGRPPASLADLLPDYLKAVPQDPLTGKDMSYPLK